MSKFIILLFVVAFVACATASDDDDDDAGFPSLGLFSGLFSDVDKTFDDLRNMKPDGPNSHVEGKSHYQSDSETIVNGKVVNKEHETDDIKNKDGEVHEEHSKQ
ncbi:uncharacterized protein LOC125225583 [Leguminivora glycinivorella]|uniref:uncharacterized protein LOC125225583 n=1 Tax=Leguminivora glycinivorella TaxID=1035111 RepID=UPI00200BC87F|nr:uncharacterized protein LOC125225583 [Leguminivora glycinivorella]